MLHRINKKYVLVASTITVSLGIVWVVMNQDSTQCPTPETFVQDFNNWSIEFLDGNPTYGEKEQREGWQKHLEEMGCIESQDIIDNAICADCEENEL